MAQVTILGAKGGPAVRKDGAMPTALLVQMGGVQIVVDCGLGVTRGLVQAGFDLRGLSQIVITHLHSDHVLELGPLIHTAWTTGLKTPLHIWGPPGLRAYWDGFMASMAFDCNLRVADEGRPPLGDLVQLHVLEEGAFDIGPVAAQALRVLHPPVLDCFALRLDAGGKSLCLSADTAHFPPLADLAHSADVLLHEAMLPQGVEAIIAKTGMGDQLRAHLANSHSTAAQAAQIATQAGVGHLVFYHIIPADDPAFGLPDWQAAIAGHWNGPFTLAHDGLTIEF
ncbi:MBL fold metallo-hydrolase [Roseinatronobacter sp.]|uniref:MBL fold metallo-hydrolase n=1 Tax=Roseinatronobacter sp. TaxID=1945755 RepID=UPI0025EF3D42|nr:MBL fold metallo-hydrolase [Roseibaca sp.]